MYLLRLLGSLFLLFGCCDSLQSATRECVDTCKEKKVRIFIVCVMFYYNCDEHAISAYHNRNKAVIQYSF